MRILPKRNDQTAGISGGFRITAAEHKASWNFQHFIHDLASALHGKNLKLMVALPAADWSYDYKYFASQVDAIILMNYDFRWSSSAPGPIAPEDWFIQNIDNMVKLVPPEKLVMGVANYGYDWPAKSKRVPHPLAQSVTFQQGVITAVESGSDILLDPDSLNLHYSYEDDNNLTHTVWMTDGVTAYNQLPRCGSAPASREPLYGSSAWKIRFRLGHLGRHACGRRNPQ